MKGQRLLNDSSLGPENTITQYISMYFEVDQGLNMRGWYLAVCIWPPGLLLWAPLLLGLVEQLEKH